MAQLSPDNLSRQHQKDLARFRTGGLGSLLKPLIFVLIFFVAIGIIVSVVNRSSVGSDSLERARHDLIETGVLWNEDFSIQHESYRDWLRRHGTQSELKFFDSVSQLLFRSAAGIGAGVEAHEDPSFFRSAFLSLHFGLLRAIFILIACWRLWCTAIILAMIWGVLTRRVHTKADILGQTGNGRLFFSGVRVSLEPMDSTGSPQTQIRGLACAPHASLPVTKSSSLGKLLDQYGVATGTNLGLAAIIIEHGKFPAYVGPNDEDGLLENYFHGGTLQDVAALLIDKALSLHQIYRTAQLTGEKPDFKPSATSNEPAGPRPLGQAPKTTLTEHVDQLQQAMHRVLSPYMRGNLADIRPAQVATMILALEAGKVMAYASEAGRWQRRSSFPQLSARAILHSVPEFGTDYDFAERTLIRRALVFASRSSVFAPVRFPIDLTDQERALRQWAELLLACPHELQTAADEVELVGILSDTHRTWSQAFFDGILSLNPEVVDEVYATPGNLFFVPMAKLVKMLRKMIDPACLRRLDELVALVSQKQRLQAMSVDFSEAADKPAAPTSADRVFPPLAHRDVKALAREHSMSSEEIRAWSSLRVVLNAYGWLARRVGDYSVPESSIISVVMKLDQGSPGVNDLGFIGKHGMVPLRGTRLEEKWGKFWQTRFIQIQRANMAETPADFERLMKGIERSLDEEENSTAANASGATGSGNSSSHERF